MKNRAEISGIKYPSTYARKISIPTNNPYIDFTGTKDQMSIKVYILQHLKWWTQSCERYGELQICQTQLLLKWTYTMCQPEFQSYI